MSSPVRVVERQVRRVRRRLFWQTLLHNLLVCWAAALALAAFWFLLRPFTFAALGETVRWAVPGTFLGLGTLVGIVLGFVRGPSQVGAALALDDRFGLKERVTTLLTLSPEQSQSPAGQTLLEDVTHKVSDLAVTTRFPVTVPWSQTLLPVGALVLAVAACFFDPFLSSLKFGSAATADAAPVVNAKDIQQQLENIQKVSAARTIDQPKSEELKELEDALDKLLKQPLDLQDQDKLRERIGEMRKLEDKMKDRLDALKDKTAKTDNLKKLLEKLANSDRRNKEGPGKDFEEALSKGKFDKAREMLEKLTKDMKDNKLTREQQKQLAEQFKEMKEKLQKLIDENELAKQLKQDAKDGKISPQELQRMLDENFKDLQELADLLGNCGEDLESGNNLQALERLGQLIDAFKDGELTDEELRKLLVDKELLEGACNALCQGCGDCEGNINGLGKGRRPGARRPISPNDPDSKITPQRQKAEVDPKGQQRLAGFVSGGSFSKIPARAVEGAFRQATQEAPEAIERQRIPDDAADIARGYFQRLGNQK